MKPKDEERTEVRRLARDLGLKPRDLSVMFGINVAQVKKWLVTPHVDRTDV